MFAFVLETVFSIVDVSVEDNADAKLGDKKEVTIVSVSLKKYFLIFLKKINMNFNIRTILLYKSS